MFNINDLYSGVIYSNVSKTHVSWTHIFGFTANDDMRLELRNRSAPAVHCWVIIHCLEVSCKEDQITSAQREWFIVVQLTDKQWIITQQFTHWSWSISILTHSKRRKHIRSLQLLPTFRHCTGELPPIIRLRRIPLHVIVTFSSVKTTLHRLTPWVTSFSSDVSSTHFSSELLCDISQFVTVGSIGEVC